VQRPLGGSGGAASGLTPQQQQQQQGNGPPGRLTDLLDFIKTEFEGVTQEAQQFKLQNAEYENHGLPLAFCLPASPLCH
jgi:hypothetical protein